MHNFPSLFWHHFTFFLLQIDELSHFTVYQDMEKDNKSVPMRVFSNTMSNYTIDTKTPNATTSILQNVLPTQAGHRHAIHQRLTEIQMCPNEIIDLTSAHATTVAMVNSPLNLHAQAYEISKINTTMMSVYDVNKSMMNNFVEISPVVTTIGSFELLKGISKGKKSNLM